MSRDHDYFVYMVTNETRTVLYIGITSDLEGRLWEHANGEGSKFTRKYHVHKLLFTSTSATCMPPSPARSNSKAGRAPRRKP